MRPLSVKLILPALTEATSPYWRPIKYSLFPPLGLATLASYLSPDDRARFGAIVERLAVLGTAFGPNVLADEQSTVFALSEAEVEGLPDFARAAAAATARDHKLNAPYAVTASRSRERS